MPGANCRIGVLSTGDQQTQAIAGPLAAERNGALEQDPGFRAVIPQAYLTCLRVRRPFEAVEEGTRPHMLRRIYTEALALHGRMILTRPAPRTGLTLETLAVNDA